MAQGGPGPRADEPWIAGLGLRGVGGEVRRIQVAQLPKKEAETFRGVLSVHMTAGEGWIVTRFEKVAFESLVAVEHDRFCEPFGNPATPSEPFDQQRKWPIEKQIPKQSGKEVVSRDVMPGIGFHAQTDSNEVTVRHSIKQPRASGFNRFYRSSLPSEQVACACDSLGEGGKKSIGRRLQKAVARTHGTELCKLAPSTGRLNLCKNFFLW